MRTKFFLAAVAITFGSVIHAQSLSPEDIARMLDEQRPVINPYAALLNDPNPTRGIGAIRIMMESGDPELVRLALEHGLLSANPDVQLAALDGYLKTRPRLLVTIDGKEGINNSLTFFAKAMDATYAEDGRIFYRWQLGSYDEDADCTLDNNGSSCAFTINVNGIFMSATSNGYTMRGMVSISPDGDVIGNPSIGDDRYPVRIQLLQ